jgi:RNA-directed DNA polymerase
MALTAGTRLGPYEILAPIGAGGMGEVYRARDTKLKRKVALKVLPDSFASDPERMARFQREAEVLASLNHPNIAQIYGVEERALVMELVPGESLKGPLPLETALNYAKQVADALEAAHDKGIVRHVSEESDRAVVPVNLSNKEEKSSAEAGEERARAKENIVQSNTSPTQSGERVNQGLRGVRQVARERKQERFTALLHHLTVDLLRDSFLALKRQAAPGVDGVRWKEYETGLENRLVDLHSRVHRGAYRAQASRRVYIPKADGRQRPLGIAALEDKIVQQAVVIILNEIYEVDFKGFSYGFRPGRSPHQALDALNMGLYCKRVNWVLDADIRGFFDQMSHEWTMKFVQHRVADPRIVRLIQKWLKAGVSEEGQWSETKVGTPQGAVMTP